MFQYIQSEEDAKNLYILFKNVMETYKDKGLSDQQLFNIIENKYYMDYIMPHEMNQISCNDDTYSDYYDNDDNYDGYDGYDN
jgi:phosphoenolpyruvate synthase/pyruvate phosphate dikinase